MPGADPFQLLGKTIAGGKYRIDRLLGEGGFGVVYAGTHGMLGQAVAIKCIKPQAGAHQHDARTTDAFLREAKVLFTLTHPNIVRLYDVGAEPTPYGSMPYLVLELLHGVALDHEMERRGQTGGRMFSARELAALLDPVMDAVAFAHERSVAHRDLKPSNVMLVRDPVRGMVPKVVDFGVARMGPAPTQLEGGQSYATQAPFTPRYAAPEQWDPNLGPPGIASDIFSLGLLVAEACTFRCVMPGDSPASILRAVMDTQRPPLVTPQRPNLPQALDAVLARATRVRPVERFGSAREMQQALRAAFGPASMSPPSALPHRPPSDAPPAYARPPEPRSSPSSTVTPVVPPAAATLASAGTKPRGTGAVLGIVAIIAVTLLSGLALVLFFLDRSRERPEAVGATAAASAPISTPTSTPTSTSSPSPTSSPSRAVGRRGKVKYGGVTGPDPFWTQGEIAAVVQSHLAEPTACLDEADDNANLHGYVDMIVGIDATGATTDVMCDVRGNHTPPAQVFCACVSAKASSWKYPPSHGKLGLLTSGSPIVTLVLP